MEHMLEDYSGRKTHQISAPSGEKMAPKWPIFGQKCHFWPLEAGEAPNGSQKWYKWWYTLDYMLEDYSGRKPRQKRAPSGAETAPKWPIYDQKCLVWPLVAQKSVFCYRTPDFVNGPFVALNDIFDLAPSDRFLNFSFPSYGVSPSGLRPKNLHFFTLHPYNPHFLGSDGSDPMGS